MKQIIVLLTAASCLPIGGCSPASDRASRSPSEEGSPAHIPDTPSKTVVTVEGLDSLMIGHPVPQQSEWEVRGAPVDQGCTTARSADVPGVYAILEDGKVRRITIGEGSKVKLAEGIGVGSREGQLKAKFPSFREEPHKYEEAPAKYIGSHDLKPGASGWRFEIASTGKVSRIHVGQMPVLAYVEGCG